jgi:hypothetical protein
MEDGDGGCVCVGGGGSCPPPFFCSCCCERTLDNDHGTVSPPCAVSFPQFVGSLVYGVRFLLWHPEQSTAARFPTQFKLGVQTLLLCASRPECVLSQIPADLVHFILNMCPWDHFGDKAPPHEPDAGLGEAFVDHGVGWSTGNYRQMIHQHMYECGAFEQQGILNLRERVGGLRV